MKSLLKFIGILVVIIVVGLFIVGASLNAIVKTGIATMGTQMVGAPVSVEDVDISLVSDGGRMRADVKSLVIKNPPPFQTPRAIVLPYVNIKVDRDSVLTNTIVIEEIIIDSPEITYEGSDRGSNLSRIQENVQGYSMGGFADHSEQTEQKKNAEQESAKEGAKKVQIARVVIINAKVNLSLTGLQGKSIQMTLPDIVLKDIGKQEGGVGFQEAGAQIFGALFDGVEKVVPGSGKFLGEEIEKLSGSVKELGQEAEKIGKDLLRGILNEQ